MELCDKVIGILLTAGLIVFVAEIVVIAFGLGIAFIVHDALLIIIAAGAVMAMLYTCFETRLLNIHK